MSLGSKISKLRKARNMTQAELAEHMAISSQAISKWEKDSSAPDFDTVIRLSELFNVPLTYFVTGELEEKVEEVKEVKEVIEVIDQLEEVKEKYVVKNIDIETVFVRKKPFILFPILFSFFCGIYTFCSVKYLLPLFITINNAIIYNILNIFLSYLVFSFSFCLSYSSKVFKLYEDNLIKIFNFKKLIHKLIIIKNIISLILKIVNIVVCILYSAVQFPISIVTYYKRVSL